METFDSIVNNRRSVRKYQAKKVDRDVITQCVEAARMAPSAENVQPWRFIVIDDEDVKHEFCKSAFSGIYSYMKWAEKAPVIVVLVAKLDVLANRIGKQIQGTNYYLLDMGISGEHFVLKAHELGIGTCWIGWFHAKKTRKFFKLPPGHKAVSLISMGYPEKPVTRERELRQLNEILYFNKYR
ncbi:MAG: nitroreductase family protein [candidate division KSB1 bacterium]|jgi:nitroreductase|nr:nitroreductase family protein [candidate division KSB1 bacterium]